MPGGACRQQMRGIVPAAPPAAHQVDPSGAAPRPPCRHPLEIYRSRILEVRPFGGGGEEYPRDY